MAIPHGMTTSNNYRTDRNILLFKGKYFIQSPLGERQYRNKFRCNGDLAKLTISPKNEHINN